MRASNRRIVPLLAFVIAAGLAAGEARADCPDPTNCICQSGLDGILDARITSVDLPRASVTIDAVHGDAGPWSAGQTLTLPADRADKPGRRVLIYVSDGATARTLAVEDDGQFVCEEADPDFRLPADEVVRVALTGDSCSTELDRLGLRAPECRDTGFLPSGCSSAGRGLGFIGLCLATLCLGALRVRRVRQR